MFLLAAGLIATTTAVVDAQGPLPDVNTTAAQGTCADLGLPVVEPLAVVWQSDTDPIVNPSYTWAYGDVDRLWDNAVDEYWFHWYDAVPGPDPFVVYEFEPNTVIEAVQFTNDWSDGDLQLQGLDDADEAISGITTVPLDNPFISFTAPLNAMTVAAMKMTTSTQQVKLLEVDFCGKPNTPITNLDLAVSAPDCELLAATWTQQPGAVHQLTVIDSSNAQVDDQSGMTGTYGPVQVMAGIYTVTVTATSPGGTFSDSATVSVTDCGPNPCGSADAFCGSVNVIDSFADAPLPAGADAGMQWTAVANYYADYGDRPGMCSIDVHNSYWTAVPGANGLTYYPSWHAPIHDPGGPEECRFTHEHGLDPRDSDLYDEDHPTNIGVPFGFVHANGPSGGPDREDHVGHKVVVWNDFQLTTNNPYREGNFTLNIFEPSGQPVTCDWYSKLHQGTHSTDALGFNLHEYFLNYSCDDGTEVRLKELTDFGFELAEDAVPQPGDDDYPQDPADLLEPPYTVNGGTGTANGCKGWFPTNLPGPASDPDPLHPDSDFGDAGRGFSCLMNDGKIEELWKPSAKLRAPGDGASLDYDPYYVVMNPNRYAIYDWWEFLDQDGDHVGENAMISMVDFCVDGSELRNELLRPEAPGNIVKVGTFYPGTFRVRTYCDALDPAAVAQWEQDIAAAGGDNTALMKERKESADNTYLGTRRGVHTKGPRVYGGPSNFGSLAFFCSNHVGNDSVWPTNPNTGELVSNTNVWSPGDPVPVCTSGVAQILSTVNNGHNPVEGSTAGATEVDGAFISNGPASEITIDMDALYPNHGVRAPN